MITSKANPKIKDLRLLKQAKHRALREEYLIEGARLVEEALRQVLPLKRIIYSPRLEESERGAALLSSARRKAPQAEWIYVSDEVMGSLSDTQTHQGILAGLARNEWTWEGLRGREGLVLFFWELQDPGNLGTIFRVAEAGACAGLVLSKDSVDPYSPKAVRASMGSLFRLPFLVNQDPGESVKILRSRGYRVWATSLAEGIPFWEVDLTPPSAVLFGQEGAGLPEELTAAADGVLTIPMKGKAESLNVAMAAGLVVYEAFRQRTGRGGEKNRKE